MTDVDLSGNEYVEAFVGQTHIDPNNHQFWHQLLTNSFNFMRVQDPYTVDKVFDPYLVRLTLNNSESLNIGSLVKVFLLRIEKIKALNNTGANQYFTFQAFNALYLLRTICKSIIETQSEEHLIKNLKAFDESNRQTVNEKPQQQPSQSSNTPNIDIVAPTSQSTTAVRNVSIVETLETAQQSDIDVIPTTNVQNNASDHAKADTIAEPNQPSATVQPEKDKPIIAGIAMLDHLVNTVISIIVDIPLNDLTYLLKVESINLLLTLLSVQLFASNPITSNSLIYDSVMKRKSSIHALILTKTLLLNFIQQPPAPIESGSIIIGIASSLWKVLTLGYGSNEDDEEDDRMTPLARQSLLLLNVLTNHYSTGYNPYREAVISCQDYDYDYQNPNMNSQVLIDPSSSQTAKLANGTKISFRSLYDSICQFFEDDQVALLLYLLLHHNNVFKQFILVTSADRLDLLVIQLLKVIYKKIEKGSHHTYMVLIILIILSEQRAFNTAIHSIVVREVPWYKDRLLTDISLGSFLALILVRSIQYNTFRAEDKFLHTNLFAVLSNMSNHIVWMNSHVCQRITDLLERLTKRFTIKNPIQVEQLPMQQNLRPITISDQPSSSFTTAQQSTPQQQSTSSNNVEQYHAREPLSIQSKDQASVCINDRNATSTINLEDADQSSVDVGPAANRAESIASSDTNSQAVISLDSQRNLHLIEDTIKNLLVIINNILNLKMKENNDLIYTLLYKKKTFKQLLTSSVFYNDAINIERILTYIYSKIKLQEHVLSTEEIKAIIKEASCEWNYDQPRDSNNQLSFKYVEDEQPEGFFVPYIWTHIYYSAGISWNAKRIMLFDPNQL